MTPTPPQETSCHRRARTGREQATRPSPPHRRRSTRTCRRASSQRVPHRSGRRPPGRWRTRVPNPRSPGRSRARDTTPGPSPRSRRPMPDQPLRSQRPDGRPPRHPPEAQPSPPQPAFRPTAPPLNAPTNAPSRSFPPRNRIHRRRPGGCDTRSLRARYRAPHGSREHPRCAVTPLAGAGASCVAWTANPHRSTATRSPLPPSMPARVIDLSLTCPGVTMPFGAAHDVGLGVDACMARRSTTRDGG